jgi:DNA-binding winged helix-turn-helix (wHTH) protein
MMVRGDRSVDVFVRKLRTKLEKLSPEWRYVHTHFGVGYRFAAEPVAAEVEAAPVAQPGPESAAATPAAQSADVRLGLALSR